VRLMEKMFEKIEIIIDYNMDRPPECKGSTELYEIFDDGAISYCSCYECSMLDKDIDKEHIDEVITILETILSKIKEKYNHR